MTKVKADTKAGIRSVVEALRDRDESARGVIANLCEPMASIRSKPGRPPKARADVVQVTAYIERATHLAAKRALLDREVECGQKQEFSGLVQLLLNQWLAAQSESRHERFGGIGRSLDPGKGVESE